MPTPILGLPYPVSSDTADVPRDIKALADAIDALGTVPVGTLLMWPTANAPTAYLLCNGTPVLAADYPKLAAVLGSQGGQILLPDFRNRFPGGAGDVPVGGQGGSNSYKLTAAQSGMPGHSHGGTSGTNNQSLNHQHSFTTATDGWHAHTPGSAGWQFVLADGNVVAGGAANGSFGIVPYRQGGGNYGINATTNNGGGHSHGGGTDVGQGNVNHDHAISPEAARDATADHENRPAFIAVNFIIRAL